MSLSHYDPDPGLNADPDSHSQVWFTATTWPKFLEEANATAAVECTWPEGCDHLAQRPPMGGDPGDARCPVHEEDE